MVSFYHFSLTVMKVIVGKNQTPKRLPNCQNAARKSFFVVNFTDFIQKVCLTKIIKTPLILFESRLYQVVSGRSHNPHTKPNLLLSQFAN